MTKLQQRIIDKDYILLDCIEEKWAAKTKAEIVEYYKDNSVHVYVKEFKQKVLGFIVILDGELIKDWFIKLKYQTYKYKNEINDLRESMDLFYEDLNSLDDFSLNECTLKA